MQQLSIFLKEKKFEKAENAKDDNPVKKYCFERAKAQWSHPTKPFVVHWGQNTWHLKKMSDWCYLKSICDDAERRGQVWSKVFWGSLKV